MSDSEDEVDNRSNKFINMGENKGVICFHCKKGVSGAVLCKKCNGIFHHDCIIVAARGRSATCIHEAKVTGEIQESQEEENPQFEIRMLRMKVKLLEELLLESRSKNEILILNNQLLLEKIGTVEKTKNKQSEKNDNYIKQFHKMEQCQQQSQKPHEEHNSQNPTTHALQSVKRDTAKSKQTDISTTDAEWTLVSRKKQIKKPEKVICTGIKSGEALFQGVKKRKWIYVGKIAGKKTTVDDVEKYMKQERNFKEVQVKKLDSKGENSAFTVGVTLEEDFTAICKEEFWPKGVEIREFNFRNFFRQGKRSITRK